MGNLNFIPVVDKPVVTDWVKQAFYRYRKEQDTYLNGLYKELYQILGHFTDLEASIFTDSLTGYQQYGLSSFQVGERYDIERLDVPLYKTALIHRMLTIIEKEYPLYPLLGRIKSELPTESGLSKSAEKTKPCWTNNTRQKKSQWYGV